jgi:hypothetical protein
LKASKKMTDTVRVAGKSRLSFVKSSNVVSGPSRIPDFLDSSSKSLEHSPVPRCPVAAATEVVVRQTRLPVIDVIIYAYAQCTEFWRWGFVFLVSLWFMALILG